MRGPLYVGNQTRSSVTHRLGRAMLLCTHAPFDLNLLVGDKLSHWVVNSVSALGRYDLEGAMGPDDFGVEEREECTYVHSFNDSASQRFQTREV